MAKLQFSGHDSFECRRFWLKKGYDHVLGGNKFNEEAVVLLGVGRNMVTSIRFWMRAYGLTDDKDQLTDFATLIFDDNGLDPYLEDEATLWLLHYQLVSQNYSSIYSIIFNKFRRQKPEFNKEHLALYIKAEFKTEINEATFSKDFEAFTKTYVPRTDEPEENYEGLLTELHLVAEIAKDKNKDRKKLYVIEPNDRANIPSAIILYCMLNHHSGESISFESASSEEDSVGVVFAMTKQGLANKMEEIAKDFNLVYSDTAGVKELQFKRRRPRPNEILTNYYQNANVN